MDAKYTDFNKLNRLLVASFEAEKLYYNAAQDAKNTELKRFLNYMAVERNRMSHSISNELHSRDIEPLKADAEKGNVDRTWDEIKEALEHFDASVIIAQCIARDQNNIVRYTELIDSALLPDTILHMLYTQRKQLLWYKKQALLHKVDPTKKEGATREEMLHGADSATDDEALNDDIATMKKL